jgi:hypothetical protein
LAFGRRPTPIPELDAALVTLQRTRRALRLARPLIALLVEKGKELLDIIDEALR